jgi:hypothetical protein
MDLLDVFGGQDNLVLMCEARRFKRDGDGSVSFWVGPYIVRVSKSTYTHYPYYLHISHRKTKDYQCNCSVTEGQVRYSFNCSVTEVQARYAFSRFTGFVLEF